MYEHSAAGHHKGGKPKCYFLLLGTLHHLCLHKAATLQTSNNPKFATCLAAALGSRQEETPRGRLCSPLPDLPTKRMSGNFAIWLVMSASAFLRSATGLNLLLADSRTRVPSGTGNVVTTINGMWIGRLTRQCRGSGVHRTCGLSVGIKPPVSFTTALICGSGPSSEEDIARDLTCSSAAANVFVGMGDSSLPDAELLSSIFDYCRDNFAALAIGAAVNIPKWLENRKPHPRRSVLWFWK